MSQALSLPPGRSACGDRAIVACTIYTAPAARAPQARRLLFEPSLRNQLPLALLALAAVACRSEGPPAAPEQAVLERRTEALRRLVAAAEQGPLVPLERVLVVVSEGLVKELLARAMPWDQVVSDRYRVRVAGADVSFEDGFALIRLDGRVSLVGALDSEVFAEVRVFASLDVVELAPESGVLRGRLALITFDARRVGLFGESEVGRELLDEFGRQRLEAFAALASSLDIPVRLEKAVEVPAVGPDGPVSIAAATVPIRVAVTDVNAFRGRLWISVDAAVGSAATGAGATASSAETPSEREGS